MRTGRRHLGPVLMSSDAETPQYFDGTFHGTYANVSVTQRVGCQSLISYQGDYMTLNFNGSAIYVYGGKVSRVESIVDRCERSPRKGYVTLTLDSARTMVPTAVSSHPRHTSFTSPIITRLTLAVTLDGGSESYMSGYGNNQLQALLYSAGGLSDSQHTIVSLRRGRRHRHVVADLARRP